MVSCESWAGTSRICSRASDEDGPDSNAQLNLKLQSLAEVLGRHTRCVAAIAIDQVLFAPPPGWTLTLTGRAGLEPAARKKPRSTRRTKRLRNLDRSQLARDATNGGPPGS